MEKVSLNKVLFLEKIIKWNDCFYAPIKTHNGKFKRYNNKIVLQKLIPNYEVCLLDNNNLDKPSISEWNRDDISFIVGVQKDLDYIELKLFYENDISKRL